jgi:aryl-phospho-beta-D-glucosidase BglC (GH1 family)
MTARVAGEDARPMLQEVLLLLRLIAIFLLSCIVSTAQTPRLSSVPASRLAHLQRGVNLSAWFAQVYDPKGYTKEHFESWITPGDIALIKSAGFDHVRLSVNPQPIMDAQNHGQGDQYLGYLDAALKMILNSGLAVELDMHPDSEFKQHLNENEFVERFVDFWRTLAKRYSSYDDERVFFEILNEPEMLDPYRWYGVESKVAGAIRQMAPENTILAAGASWDNDNDLLFLEPIRDPNVIYVFHFYEPHIFTHQGATWGAFYWHWLRDLHYPSDPKNAETVAAAVPDAVHRLDVIRYGQDHWDASRIEAEINQVSDWGKQNGVPVVCNEFGVYRHAQPQDRNAWLRDTRTSLERHHIGWAMWDYSENFGVAIKKDGKAILDPETMNALGMKVP